MKKFFLALLCCANLGALEFESLFQNERISIVKVVVDAHEEIGEHCDETARVVIATKGGTITRLEHDGRTTDVCFPTGKAIFLEPDPENETHKSVNNSSESIELLIVLLKDRPFVKNAAHEVAVDIKLSCPEVQEFQDFVSSIPTSGEDSDFDTFKKSFAESMHYLIRLVESENISNAAWNVAVDG